ncbi:MAG: serine phosphatase RsbU (regulator of sigma subunit) [Bacteroidia bacterium]
MFSTLGKAQEMGMPFVHNYSYKLYKGHPQAFRVVQNSMGLLFVANSKGVVVYDGVGWRTIKIAGNQPVYALEIDSEDRIWVGSVNELGYLEANGEGRFEYKSVLPILREVYKEEFEISKIVSYNNKKLYFTTFNGYFFEWSKDGFKAYETETGEELFALKDDVVINDSEHGLSIFRTGKTTPIKQGEYFKGIGVTSILEWKDSLWTIVGNRKLYQAQVFFDSIRQTYQVSKIQPLQTEMDGWISKHSIQSAIKLSNGQIALGSIGGGVAILSREGKLVHLYNKAKGLSENYVWGLFEDNQKQLWMALDNGVSRISTQPNFTSWGEEFGLSGYISSIIRHKGDMYVGTNEQTYLLKKGEFSPIEGVKNEETDDLVEFTDVRNNNEKSLIISTTSGLYELVNGKISIIESGIYPKSVIQSRLHPERLYVAGNRLSVFEKQQGKWRKTMEISEIPVSLGSLGEDRNGNLWAGGAPNHIVEIKVAEAESFEKAEVIVTNHLTAPDSQDGIQIQNYLGHLIFATGKGFFALDENMRTFRPMAGFGKRYTNPNFGINKFDVSEDGSVWLSVNDSENQWVEGVVRDTIRKNKAFIYKSDSLSLLPLFNTYVECIYAESNGMVWFGTPNGLVQYNPKVMLSQQSVISILIRNVTWGEDSVLFSGDNRIQDFKLHKKIELPYSSNQIHFEFALPSYSYEHSNHYSYLLGGYENSEWSEWTEEASKEYANLKEGKYTFFVRGKNYSGLEATTASFEFEILPPWYRTWWAAALTLLFVAFLIWFGIRWNTRRLHALKSKLERAVNERTKEVQAKSKELEKQKSEILRKTASLTLANQTILQNNLEVETQKEALLSQKEQLAKQNGEMAEHQDKLQGMYDDINVLSNIGKEITAHITLESIVNAVYSQVNALMPAEGFGIGVYNENMQRIEFSGYIENGGILPFHTIEMGDTKQLSAWAMFNKKEVFINDFENEFYKYIQQKNTYNLGKSPKSLIYLPLISNRKAIGVISVQSFQKDAYTSYDLNLLRNIGIYATIALENASVYNQMSSKNRKITDSINYARNIQKAIFPRESEMKNAFTDFFLLHKPRDIVSGDFYWFAQPKNVDTETLRRRGNDAIFSMNDANSNSKKTIIAAIDCTGHGVPGAFMSLLGDVFLNQIVNMQGISEPDLILKELHLLVRKALHQEDKENRDGMDAAICVIDREQNTLTFSGAKRPLIIVKDGKLEQIKGDRQAVGGSVRRKRQDFTKHVLPLDKEAVYYIYSDGYADQFGGEQDTKLREKNLLHILKSVYQLPLSAQRNALEEFLNDWGAGRNQVDDVLVIGFKI